VAKSKVVKCVGDHEGHLGAIDALAHVSTMSHDCVLRASCGDQPVSVGVVHVDRPACRPIEVDGAKETKAHGLTGKPTQEGPNRNSVLCAYRANLDSGAVARRNVIRLANRVATGRSSTRASCARDAEAHAAAGWSSR
jgi:hypothetical protein